MGGGVLCVWVTIFVFTNNIKEKLKTYRSFSDFGSDAVSIFAIYVQRGEAAISSCRPLHLEI